MINTALATKECFTDLRNENFNEFFKLNTVVFFLILG